MSSGACRALVAVVLTLVATIVMTLPVAARTDDLSQASVVTYEVFPNAGRVDVTMQFVLVSLDRPVPPQEWGPFVMENGASYRVEGASKVTGGDNVPGPGAPWVHRYIKTGKKIEAGENDIFSVTYRINTNDLEVAEDVPARVDESYVFLCVPGQWTNNHQVTVKVRGSGWTFSQSGTPMIPEDSGLVWTGAQNPEVAFTCIEGVREDRLVKQTIVGPAERDIELQAWASDPSWIRFAERETVRPLDGIRNFLGQDIPGEGKVIIREAPARAAGGYASAHDSPGVVQLDEDVGAGDVEHQMAHAWFGKDNIAELWLREGLAEWIATSLTTGACEAVTSNPDELDLSQWLVVQPTAPEDYEAVIEAQEAAACGIVAALAARMPDDTFKTEVLGSLLAGETKYNGSAGPESGTSPLVDFREWLDAVDERGLVPAGKADPAFADNLTDLDFAQDLLDDFGIPDLLPELELRSKARAMYHEFLEKAAPFGAPLAVRKDMDDWNFVRAMAYIQQSTEVYEKLIEADRLLPEAGLLPIVQPQFEAAGDEEALDAVTDFAQDLFDGAMELFEPLGALTDALPAGWTIPAAVMNALQEQRFDDVRPAIAPAITAARYISDGNEFLPQAGLLEKYQDRFENTTTAAQLEELTADARADSRNAELASRALDLLQNEVGDWSIPEAVTRPLEQGQLETGLLIVDDARAVVGAAREADLALAKAADLDLDAIGLRKETRPLFESVTTGAEMAALRERVVARGADAGAVGEALGTLNDLVPDWQIPAVIAGPVAEGDFSAAVAPAQAAQLWIENAVLTNESLDEIQALDRIKDEFENAASLEDIEAGAALAGRWAQAATEVALAIEVAARPRDMLTSFGLWGVDIDPLVEEAKTAVIAGEIDVALGKAADVIKKVEGGSSAGSLRLAGIIFFGVAVIGVGGLWIMLRRQAGPSWARSTTPHWVDKDGKRKLLGRGQKKDGK